MRNGGYYILDCTGLNLALDTAQSIPGSWKRVQTAIKTGKPIIAEGCTYGTAKVSPVTTFGWQIADDEIVIVGATLHCHVKDNNTVTVLDVASAS